jgi:hypothetical protein
MKERRCSRVVDHPARFTLKNLGWNVEVKHPETLRRKKVRNPVAGV